MTEPLRSTLKSKIPALVGGTVATVFVTLFSSYLGVKGTLVGLAFSTALTGMLSTVSEHTLQRTAERARLRYHGFRVHDPYKELYRTQQRRNVPYRLIAASMTLIGLASFASLLVIEAAAGKPIANVVQGTHGSGFSVAHNSDSTVRRSVPTEHRTHRKPKPKATYSTIPATETPSASPSSTPPTQLPVPSTSATPLPTPASTPSSGLPPSPSTMPTP